MVLKMMFKRIITYVFNYFSGLLYAIVQGISSVKSYFKFKDCLLFGAIISATDPGWKLNNIRLLYSSY